jgi:hypothetical protein
VIERLEAVKKCDRISGGAVRPLHIWLSQLKLPCFEEFAEKMINNKKTKGVRTLKMTSRNIGCSLFRVCVKMKMQCFLFVR